MQISFAGHPLEVSSQDCQDMLDCLTEWREGAARDDDNYKQYFEAADQCGQLLNRFLVRQEDALLSQSNQQTL